MNWKVNYTKHKTRWKVWSVTEFLNNRKKPYVLMMMS